MYNKFHGFSQKPFELLPDPEFLFLTPRHQQIIDSMINGIRDRKDFISLAGEVGTGKTTLIRYLLSKLAIEEKVKTVLIFHPTISFDELLENILLELDLQVTQDSKKDLLGQLNEYLTLMIPKNEVLVVFIDEAQCLSDEVMRELGILPVLKTLQVVFVGQSEFEDKLNSRGLGQLKQRVGIKHQISLLSRKESEDYINHRLRLVGSTSSGKFTPEAISLICSYAHGIPRIINILCDNSLQMGYSLSQERIDVNVVRKAIKDIEGPNSRNPVLPSLAKALRKFPLSRFRLELSLKRAPLTILALLSVGGLIFMIQSYLKQNGSPPARDSFSEFSQPVAPPSAALRSRNELDEVKETVTVIEGETLSHLAQKYYGRTNTTLITLILNSNREIMDVDLIHVNQKIKMPEITGELLISQSADHTYRIHVGTFKDAGFVRFYNSETTLSGKEIRVLPRKVSSQVSWHQVMVGRFTHKDECIEIIDKLKEKGLLPAFGGILSTE